VKDPVAAIRYLGKNRKLIRFFKNSFFCLFFGLALRRVPCGTFEQYTAYTRGHICISPIERR
jgi:hypothetical protein